MRLVLRNALIASLSLIHQLIRVRRMHKFIFLLCFVVFLGVSTPADAQLRADAALERAPIQLYDQGSAGTLLNSLFNEDTFTMRHSYEMSVGSMGGNSFSTGMYTNTMMWDFNEKWDARMDVAVAFQPFNNTPFDQNTGPQVFLRNAEVSYSPNENTRFSIQVRQSPHGAYASPYGRYGHFGHRGFGNHTTFGFSH